MGNFRVKTLKLTVRNSLCGNTQNANLVLRPLNVMVGLIGYPQTQSIS